MKKLIKHNGIKYSYCNSEYHNKSYIYTSRKIRSGTSYERYKHRYQCIVELPLQNEEKLIEKVLCLQNISKEIYINKYTLIQKYDWLFTCLMKPVQFDKWDDNTYNGFLTLDGSNHARFGCSLKPITEKYALWFIENECWNYYEDLEDEKLDNFKVYEARIKKLSKQNNIKYEGI